MNKPIIKIRNFGNAFTNFKTRNKRNNRNAVIIPPPPFPEVGNGTNDIKTIIKSKRFQLSLKYVHGIFPHANNLTTISNTKTHNINASIVLYIFPYVAFGVGYVCTATIIAARKIKPVIAF